MSNRVEFMVSGVSGIIAASLAANSVLFHMRNPPTLANSETNNKAVRLKKLRAKAHVKTGYTAEQEIELAAFAVSAFGASPADYTGGTSLGALVKKLGPDGNSKPFQETVFQAGNISICTTAGLSHVGTPTLDSQPFAYDSVQELATGTTVQRSRLQMDWEPSREGCDRGKGKIFIPSTGFVITNPTALGAGGTLRLFVEAYWEEA